MHATRTLTVERRQKVQGERILERGSVEDVRSANRALLLSLASGDGVTSCPTLAERSGLSRATVYAIAEELQRAGVLVSHGIGRSSGGRRPALLRFEPRARVAIGIEIDERAVRGVATDLLGSTLLHETTPLPGLSPGDAVTAIEAVTTTLRRAFSPEQVLGLGVAIPGIVDVNAGVVRLSVIHGWTDIRLAEMVTQRTGLRAYVASRSMSAALGEYRSGAGRGARHLIYIYAGQGLGAGSVVNGELFSGATSSAGELGHITVAPDGDLCTCGNRGCLHTVASGAALLALARTALRERPGEGHLLRRLGHPDPVRLRTIDLAEAALRGDSIAAPLVQAAGRYVGLAAATVVNLFNPDRVIVGGPLVAAGPIFMDALCDEAERRSLAVPFSAAEFAVSALGEDAAPVGAAALVLRHAAGLLSHSE